jgi:hypothetical protein
MPQRPHRQVPVSRAAAMPGLVHDPRRVLARIGRLTAASPALDLVADALQAGELSGAARALTEALLREASGDPATLPKLADRVPARSLRRSNPLVLAMPG